MVVLHRHPRIVVQNDADLLHGCRGSSARADVDLPCGFRLKMAETRRWTLCATTLKDRETRRKDRSKYHCKNRTYLDTKY